VLLLLLLLLLLLRVCWHRGCYQRRRTAIKLGEAVTCYPVVSGCS